MFWRKKSKSSDAPVFTLAAATKAHPEWFAASRAEGAQLELARIRGVYESSPYLSPVHPLLERLMFDGRTHRETACVAMLAALQTDVAIRDEAAKQTNDQLQVRRH